MKTEKKLIKCICFLMLCSPCLSFGQVKKYYAKNLYVDSIIKSKKIGRAINYDETTSKEFSINSLKLYSKLSTLKKVLGKGKIISKTFMDNTLDVDNPFYYKRRYYKVKNSLFQINEKNELIGVVILDSNYILSFKNIKIGQHLNQILKKLPISKNEIGGGDNIYSMMFGIKGVFKNCNDCYTYVVLTFDENNEKLKKIYFEISDEILR